MDGSFFEFLLIYFFVRFAVCVMDMGLEILGVVAKSVLSFIDNVLEKIIHILKILYSSSKKGILFILSASVGLFTTITKVIKNPSRLFLNITKRRESRDVVSQKNLNYVFNRAENKEEIVGDLLEKDAKMKADEYSNPKRLKKMLYEVFWIKISLIKTKIENIFSKRKMKIDD